MERRVAPLLVAGDEAAATNKEKTETVGKHLCYDVELDGLSAEGRKGKAESESKATKYGGAKQEK